jgi:pyrroline-5-carboxylate reductase
MQVGLIGAGNMARALARGWGEPVLCSDGGSGRARALADELGGEALASNVEVADRSDLVVLCHKPTAAQFNAVRREIAGHAKAVASVLGGVDTENLRKAYRVPVFRFVPNTPVEVRLGVVVRVPESLIDVASAIMGVGPAYQALLAEAQIDAAVRHGIAPGLAGQLVVETMAGTAALLHKRDYDTLAVRREVTSPGGTTARGLAALERAGVRAAFQDAADAVVGAAR